MLGGNAVKIAIVVVLLGAAIVITILFNKEGPQSKLADGATQKTYKDMVCVESLKHFQMPNEVWKAAVDVAPPLENTGKARTRRSLRRPKMIECEECDGGIAVEAAKCPNSDTWYPILNEDGSSGRCPDL
jgi:hypothetical protein